MKTNVTSPDSISMKPFALLWSGQAISLLGTQITHFALTWWLTLETGSARVLVAAMLAGFLPQVVLGPLAGALIDRWSRHRILVLSDALTAAASLVLAVLFWTERAATWHVLAVLLIRALGTAFHLPTMTASTSLMVPKEHLTRVQGINESLDGLLLIVTAPLGAVLLGVLPIASILAIDVVTAVFGIVPLFLIRIPQPERGREEKAEASLAGDLLEGLSYLRSWPGLLILVAMGTLVNFFTVPVSALLPLLITQHFGGTALQFAWMGSAFGLGILAGGVTLGVWGGFKRRVATSLSGVLGLGVCLAIVALAPSSAYVLALGGIFGVGFMVTMSNGPMQAALQAVVAPAYQGRLFGLMHTLALMATPLGLAIAGPAADLVGVRAILMASAVACVVKGLVGLSLPIVLYLEDDVHPRRDTMRPDMTEPLEET